ncbi:MAG: VWA domain-containing protein [Verrucomicrobiales bacterium]|nr:VWA domain-containing protein [Verrucomicrobiales bacterium]
MNHFLLQLLGVRTDGAGTVVGVGFEFQPALAWGWVLLLLAMAVAAAVLAYRRRDVVLTPRRRAVLLGLRLLALTGLCLVFLRPGLVLTVEGLVRQALVLLFDQSASTTLRDPRTEAPDRVRAAIAAGQVSASGGLNQRVPESTGAPLATRQEVLRHALTNRELALVDRLQRDFDLRVAGFAEGLSPMALGPSAAPAVSATRGGTSNREPASAPGLRWSASAISEALRAEGRESAPGSALRELADRVRGRSVSSVVLFTDGIRNAGSEPLEAAARLKESGMMLHVVGMGTGAPRDLLVADVVVPDAVFVRDEVPVRVRFLARGLTGQTVKLSLKLDGQEVTSSEVAIAEDGEREVFLKLTPEQTGDFEITAELPVRADEILAENNRLSRRLRVVDDKVRVLFLEQSPRWEFRYLQALLLRDRRVDLKCVLFDGDPAIARGPGTPYLETVPTRREDLFAYDLILFGDIDPKNFTPAQLDLFGEFVARSGGSFLMIAGRRFSPWSYQDTALERILPVEFDRSAAASAATALFDRPTKLELTAKGKASILLRMSEDAAENQQKWEALPPLFWTAPVRRAKPAAEVLVQDLGRGEATPPLPLVALQQYGVGQTMFVGSDNTWRWRRNRGEEFYASFWGRSIQRLALQHLLSGGRRTQLMLDRMVAMPGERVSVSARLFDSAFEPLTDPLTRVLVDLESGGGTKSATAELLLRLVPDQPGLFQGDWVGTVPGRYRFRAGDTAVATADLTVQDRLVEVGETAMQEGAMRSWAAAGGGEFFREEDLHRLPDAVSRQARRVTSRVGVDLWSSPAYYLVVVLLFGLEWLMRKIWQLK